MAKCGYTTLMDFVKVYPNTVSNEICDEIVNYFEDGYKIKSFVGRENEESKRENGQGHKDYDIRKGYELNITQKIDDDELWNYYHKILLKNANNYINRYRLELEEAHKEASQHIRGVNGVIGKDSGFGQFYVPEDDILLEHFRVRKYNPISTENIDGDYFNLHIDIQDYYSAKRMMVILLYLNDVEEGGETSFDFLSYYGEPATVKPTKGSLLMFHPSFMYPHTAHPPISCPKYTVQTYLHHPDGI